MSSRKRSAKLGSILVYVDEPQIITLISGKTRIVALAIPDDDDLRAMFLATTVSERDWEKYISGSVDLRYLFTFPIRVHYKFDLNSIDALKRVMMTRVLGEIDEKFLPPPRFFSVNHTHDDEVNNAPTEQEKLIIDGEWELTDFGQFQQKFSDLYAFIISTHNYIDEECPEKTRKRIKDAFLNRPFQGGFSYVHLFGDLNDNVPRADQLNLKRIKYASPGEVEMFGRENIFAELQDIIPNFIDNRQEIGKMYNKFYKFLSNGRYLKMSGGEFLDLDPGASYIKRSSEALAKAMLAPKFETVWLLTNENALVAAKVVLSFYRRLQDAAMYFAQGRVSY